MNFRRVFVEKKEEFNVESETLYKDFKDYLNVKSLEKVRVINVYDIINSTKEEYDKIVENILWEKSLDYIYEGSISFKDSEKYFRVEFVPGQYNQREDSAIQSIALLLCKKDIQVKHSKILVFEGVDEEELNLIKDYYINPVEMREIDLNAFTYKEHKESDKEIETIEDLLRCQKKRYPL